MAEDTNSVNPRRTLLTLRILWGAMLFGEVLLIAVMLALTMGQLQAAPTTTGNTIFIASIIAVVTGTGVGYIARMQIYKANWVEDHIKPQGYFTGNLILLAVLEGAAILAIVNILISQTVWPTIAPAALAMVMQIINFPTGKAMQAPLMDNLTHD